MDFTLLPKVELHLHLDCSLSFGVVKKLDPAVTESEYRQCFTGPPKFSGLAEYLTRAARSIELMQTAENLRLVTLDLFEQLQQEGVIYAEIRFAPFEHIQNGLSPAQVVQAVAQAVEEGAQTTGIMAGLILCTLRHYTATQSLETAKLVEGFKGSAVAGFDIASDEATYPIDAHVRAFEFAQDKGLNRTAHAGEARGADSVWEILRYFKPQRLGHGVRSIEDPALIEELKRQNIHLEICPVSNIQTNVYPQIADHPVDRLYRSGVSVSINTDARTICNVTLQEEYELLRTTFQWAQTDFLRCNLNAIEHAFLPATVKALLLEKLRAAYAR